MNDYQLHVIGRVYSTIRDRRLAPKQGFKGGPEATIVFEAAYAEALADLEVGDDIIVITWLDRADRSTLAVHPRDDFSIRLTGVFSTRSPDRPNPIGLHRVRIMARIDALSIRVQGLEALDLTPVIDVKPVLDGHREA